MKNDEFKKARGGWSRMLEISCKKCSDRIGYYQKDGPGLLKRLYLDRMTGYSGESDPLTCAKCNEILGIKIIYEKEDRPAYRLFIGSVTSRIVKVKAIQHLVS